MAKSNAFETDILELFFNGTAIADLAEDDTSSPATSLYVSLHTADPGEAGDQTTNEATYTSYARVAVTRDGANWSVSGDTVSNVAAIEFPVSTGTDNTITHVGVGTASSGSGYLMYKGALGSSKLIESGDTPRFLAGDLDITED